LPEVVSVSYRRRIHYQNLARVLDMISEIERIT
jgi:hypothetical protein